MARSRSTACATAYGLPLSSASSAASVSRSRSISAANLKSSAPRALASMRRHTEPRAKAACAALTATCGRASTARRRSRRGGGRDEVRQARQGKAAVQARQSEARQGEARRGEARRGKARRTAHARARARGTRTSMSSAKPSLTRASSAPVAGLTVAKVLLEMELTNLPAEQRRRGRRGGGAVRAVCQPCPGSRPTKRRAHAAAQQFHHFQRTIDVELRVLNLGRAHLARRRSVCGVAMSDLLHNQMVLSVQLCQCVNRATVIDSTQSLGNWLAASSQRRSPYAAGDTAASACIFINPLLAAAKRPLTEPILLELFPSPARDPINQSDDFH